MINWKYEKAQIIQQRTFLLCILFFILFLCLIIRLFYLQVIQGDTYLLLADKNRVAIRPLLPRRGNIYDRNGIKIAENKKIFRAIFTREKIKNYKESLLNFYKLIPTSKENQDRIENEIKTKRAFIPVILKNNLSYEEIALISLNAPDLKGIHIEESLTRVYGMEEKTAHVLGYLAKPSEDNLDKNDTFSSLIDYRTGYTGVEKILEEKLRGKPGLLKSEINAYGRTVQILEKQLPIPGENITLTINSFLQQYGTNLFGNESGSAIVMDIKTGEILMLVSLPSFDANLFSTPISVKDWNNLNNNPKKPLINKSISGIYSPGSIFKLVVALAGLESGDIKLGEKEYCNGKTKLGKQIFHCWKEHGHGHLDVVGALRESCDVFFYKKAQEIGVDKIIETAEKLGFGNLTGIELSGEKKGLLPSRQWKETTKKDAWRMGDTLNLSIGQGFLTTTPIQILRATAAIANGGYLLQPHLLKKDTPFQEKKLPFKKQNLDTIKKGMNEVVNNQHGTAYWSRFSVNGQTMAGKTASTQVKRISLKERLEGLKKQEELPWEWRDHGLFVAFAPVDSPRYVAIVVVEHGGGGSKSAAPIASKLLKKVLQLETQKGI